MKILFLLLLMLAMTTTQDMDCHCDWKNHNVFCRHQFLTKFNNHDISCGYTFWNMDLSENRLDEFPNDLQQFRKVNMSHNSLSHLEASIQQKVENLDVSNNVITHIDLTNNFLSLRYLYASRNYLGLLDDDFLEGECNIEHLDVSENKIKTLQALTRCSQLSVLVASHNKISRVSNKLVLLKKLEVLDLSSNKIEDISGLPTTVEMLDLSENNIMISHSSFKNLVSLKDLDLSTNNIVILESSAFATLTSLRSLKLAGNNLKTLTGDHFKGLKSLKILNLFLNAIATVSNNTFSDLPALEIVTLEANMLTSLPALQFGKYVKLIIFHGNLIKTMDHSAILTMFSGSRVERIIELQLNNFHGNDPEWSNVLKIFDWECAPKIASRVKEDLSRTIKPFHYDMYTLAASSCSCARFSKDNWIFGACISEGAEVDGLLWLDAAEVYAGLKDVHQHSQFNRDEF